MADATGTYYPTKPADEVGDVTPVVTKSTVPMGYTDGHYMGVQQQQHHKIMSGEAMASMICGIIGLFFFGIILGPIAICLGVAAKAKIRQDPEKLTGNCQATAGIIMGSIVTALYAIGILLLLVVGISDSSSSPN